jgi:hypothetical protein
LTLTAKQVSQSSTVGAKISEKVEKRVYPYPLSINTYSSQNKNGEAYGVGNYDIQSTKSRFCFFDNAVTVCFKTHVLNKAQLRFYEAKDALTPWMSTAFMSYSFSILVATPLALSPLET